MGTSGKERRRWGDLRRRVLSALLLAPIALACLWFGGGLWSGLLTIAALGLCQEWSRLCGVRTVNAVALAVPGAVLLAAAAALIGMTAAALGILVAGFLITWAFSRRVSLAGGVFYLGLALVALAWLRADPEAGLANVLFVLLIVWASDIGAYCAGRTFGGPHLAPRISPSKTWSGAVGGLVAAMAVGAAVAAWQGGVSPRVLVVAGVLGIASQAGDLFESALKRHYGVKDSGNLIPGHGGLLDRLDGLLAAAPVAALLSADLGRGILLWQ